MVEGRRKLYHEDFPQDQHRVSMARQWITSGYKECTRSTIDPSSERLKVRQVYIGNRQSKESKIKESKVTDMYNKTKVEIN